MLQLGAHNSIAGGLHQAVEHAGKYGMDIVQLFTGNPKQFPRLQTGLQSGVSLTKNNNQWAGKPIVDDDVTQFRDALQRHSVAHPLSHASYLINLAAPSDELWEKSIESMVVELQRAERLGVKYVVVHPGAFTTTSAEEGIDRVAVAIDRIHDSLGDEDSQAEILLENTAGQGSSLGHDFEHLAAMISKTRRPERIGVCFDTCHAFAAGHGFSEPGELLALKRAIDDAFGVGKIRAVHLNDSKKGKGSRVDRHEHIGHGMIGMEGFRAFVNDPDFGKIPMYMETPKGEHEGEHWDAINLRTVRDLASGKSVVIKPLASANETPAKKAPAKKASVKRAGVEQAPEKSVAKKTPAKKASAKTAAPKKKAPPQQAATPKQKPAK